MYAHSKDPFMCVITKKNCDKLSQQKLFAYIQSDCDQHRGYIGPPPWQINFVCVNGRVPQGVHFLLCKHFMKNETLEDVPSDICHHTFKRKVNNNDSKENKKKLLGTGQKAPILLRY